MSQPESFVDEVTEALRRDRLFALFRRYGWIGILLVVLIVGGAGYSEWRRAKAEAAAQAFGDGLLAAFETEDPAAVATALAALPADEAQAPLLALIRAAAPGEGPEAQAVLLQALAAAPETPALYRDLAVLKRLWLLGPDLPLNERRAALEPLAAPGAPFRPLAAEGLAILLLEEGKTEEARAAFEALLQDQDSPQGLRRRAAAMVEALGGDLAALGEENG